jgi:hypothetical protein
MIWDTNDQLSDVQALTASAPSTHVIATGPARHFFAGELMRFLVWLDAVASDANGDETYTCVVQTDDNEDFFSPTDISPTVSIPRGSVRGSRFFVEA